MKRQLVTALLVSTIVSTVFMTGNIPQAFAADAGTASTAETAADNSAGAGSADTASQAGSTDTAGAEASDTGKTAQAADTEKSDQKSDGSKVQKQDTGSTDNSSIASTEQSADYYMTVDPTPDNEALRRKYAPARKYTAQWQEYGYENGRYTSWVYMLSDGTYPRNEDYTVDGVTYHFNANAEVTGWFIAYGNIYYSGSDGKYVTGKQTIGGKSYTFSDKGVLEEGTVTIGEKTYTKGSTEDPDKKKEEPQEPEQKSGWETKDGKKYYIENGEPVKGRWAKIEDVWYYFEKDGVMAESRWVGNYYVGENGAMETDRWIGKYYVGSDGKWIPDRWEKTQRGWIYLHGDGSYKKDGWAKINGTWYYFDKNGYMAESRWIGNYYVGKSGAMATDCWIGNYYVGRSGALARNRWIGKYYVGNDGKWIPDRWVKNKTGWWYRYGDGSYPKNRWLTLNGRRYYFGNNGYAYTGWHTIGGVQYYFDPSGCHLVTGTTRTINGYKYTFNADGAVTSKVKVQTTIVPAVTTTDAMDKKAQGYSSSTSYLILVNRSTHKVGIYKGKKNAWNNVKKFSCGDGKSSTPTIEGTFTVGIKLRYFDSGRARCWYATQFRGNYLFHSVLYDQSSTLKKILDGRTGVGVSHGCVRLQISNAKWIYDNIPRGTKVVVYH